MEIEEFKGNLIKILTKVLPKIKASVIQGNVNLFDDLNMDSMGLMMFAVEFEVTMGFPLPSDTLELAHSLNFGDLTVKLHQLSFENNLI